MKVLLGNATAFCVGALVVIGLGSLWAQTIKPGKQVPGVVVHREVDLSSCAWIEFKHAQFQARVEKVLGESTVSVESPGIADCASVK